MAKLGIIAGGGDLPAALARFCVESERPYFVMAFEGQTDPDFLKEIKRRADAYEAGETSASDWEAASERNRKNRIAHRQAARIGKL